MGNCNAEKPKAKIQVLISILDFCSKLAIVVVAIRWVTIGLSGQQKESENKAWQAIITSENFISTPREQKNRNLIKDNKSNYISSYGIKNALKSLTEICKYGEGLDFVIPWKDESFLLIASGWKNVKYALGERGSCVYLSYINLDYLNLAYTALASVTRYNKLKYKYL